ncbi:MAG: tRNA glutamyl-Q(34) synthetase GluQRS [Candidatus Puniceispirillaceae bacterium]
MSHPFVTRFAPSPTGALHLGHAYAARVAHDFATRSGGKMILRIDDIDHTRCRDEFIPPILENLAWLGLNWEGSNLNATTKSEMTGQKVSRQSHRKTHYQAALKTLDNLGLIYPCYLSRRELDKVLSAPHALPSSQGKTNQRSQQVPINTDQLLSAREQSMRQAGERGPAWRLRVSEAVKKAQQMTPKTLSWFDHITGHQAAKPEEFGDVVIARADISVSYHLSVVVDDALDGINLVTRGNDLSQFTHLHRLLQTLLGLPVPEYCHHVLIRDATGKRLAKRDSAHELDDMRKLNDDPSTIFAKMPPLPI